MAEERITPVSGLPTVEDPAGPAITDPIPARLDEMAQQIADLRSRLELQSELASTPPRESSYLLGTILDLKETIGRLDERIENQGKTLKETIGRLDERIENQGKILSEHIENQGKTLKETIGRLDERIENQGKTLSERIENQGKTLSDLSDHVVGLESKFSEQVRALRTVMLSKVQFWMGIGLLVTVILGLAGIYFSTLPKP